MCERYTVLALENAARYIAQCEHGTVHIFWDNLTIRLRPANLAQVASVIENACSRIADGPGSSKGVRIKMRDLLLVFPAKDLALLRELISLAMMQIAPPGAAGKGAKCDLSPVESVSFPKNLPPYRQN